MRVRAKIAMPSPARTAEITPSTPVAVQVTRYAVSARSSASTARARVMLGAR